MKKIKTVCKIIVATSHCIPIIRMLGPEELEDNAYVIGLRT